MRSRRRTPGSRTRGASDGSETGRSSWAKSGWTWPAPKAETQRDAGGELVPRATLERRGGQHLSNSLAKNACCLWWFANTVVSLSRYKRKPHQRLRLCQDRLASGHCGVRLPQSHWSIKRNANNIFWKRRRNPLNAKLLLDQRCRRKNERKKSRVNAPRKKEINTC